MDAGYLSRILKVFDTQGLVARKPADQDGRQRVLALTEAGRAAFEPLDAASRSESGAMLRGLGPGDAEDLVAAMRTIERCLGGSPPHQPDSVTLRAPVPIQTACRGASACNSRTNG